MELYSRCGAPLYGSDTIVRTSALHIFVSFFLIPLAPPPGGGGLFADSPCSGRRASHANGHVWVPMLIRYSGRRAVTPAYSHPGCPATHFIDRSIDPKQEIRYHPHTHATC
jgi:hypothetical protein